MPTLCVEVVSPSDRPGRIQKRVRDYLTAGVPLVWVVDPEERCVFVHRPGKPVEIIEGEAEVTAEGEFPGFACRTSDIFPTYPG